MQDFERFPCFVLKNKVKLSFIFKGAEIIWRFLKYPLSHKINCKTMNSPVMAAARELK